ncbi:MAG: type I-E CRISPR-associated protein Cas6/Cse3/CasE [Thermodesulfobacteriota bacterium]
MYLSKIHINSSACRNPYEIHRVLWRLFPEDVEARRDFLFRIEHSDRNHADVLMQSKKKPEGSSVEARILAWKDFFLSLCAGQRLRFLLIANPIKTIKNEAGQTEENGETKKCRVPLIREESQRAWIERKFQYAASLESLVIDPMSPMRFRKGKEDRAGKIQPVRFQGILNVKTLEKMTDLVENGIGPAKAFGCGMLSLAKVC